MKNYFECNLPKIAPKHIKGIEKRKTVTRILKQIYNRMNKLNEALIITGLEGEQFSAAAKVYFDRKSATGEPLIDVWNAEKLAEQVMMIAPNMEYSKRYHWPKAVVIVDTAFLTIPEWEAIRMVGIGGSDAAVTMGISPYRTEQELYHDKVGTEIKMKIGEKNQFIFDYGHCLEPLVIDEFCRRTGAKIIPETRMFAKKGMKYITANIDAILEFSDGRIVIFEAKTTTNFNRNAWTDNKVPVQYVPQCRQYMTVLDDKRIVGTYIGCIYGNTPNDFLCSYINRDIDKEEEQLKIEKEFWEENVLAGVEPEESGIPEKDINVFRMITGSADKESEVIQLPQTRIDAIKEYMELNETRKAYDKKLEAVKQRQKQLSLGIMKELGQCTKGELHTGDGLFYEVSFYPKSSTKIDKEKLKLVYPDIFEEMAIVNPESSRPFSIKMKREGV
jgi:putative phage-type endonuclease